MKPSSTIISLVQRETIVALFKRIHYQHTISVALAAGQLDRACGECQRTCEERYPSPLYGTPVDAAVWTYHCGLVDRGPVDSTREEVDLPDPCAYFCPRCEAMLPPHSTMLFSDQDGLALRCALLDIGIGGEA